MKKLSLFCISSLAILASCSQEPIKPQYEDQAKNSKIIIISSQSEPRIEAQQHNNPNAGAVGAAGIALADFASEKQASNYAKKFADSFRRKEINEALANGIIESQHLQLLSSKKVEIHTTSIPEQNTYTEPTILVEISHCFTDTQNIFLTDASISYFTPNQKTPYYVIHAFTQSSIFDEPLTGFAYDPKDPELIARAEAINKKFDEMIAESPKDRHSLEKRREYELRVSRTTRTKKYPAENVVSNDPLFSQIISDLKTRTPETIRAAIEESFSQNEKNHEPISVSLITKQNVTPAREVNGYLLKPYSQGNSAIFRRQYGTGWNAPAGPVPNEIYSFPKSNNGIYFLRGCS